MPITRSPHGAETETYSLSDEDIHWIGRLVRATAEIEDIVTEHFCEVARIPLGAALLILGRMSSSGHLGLARQFASVQGGEVLAAHLECFGTDEFKDIIKCRNTVAHGVLLGKTPDGNIAFEILQDSQGVEGEEIVVTVNTYPPNSLRAAALLAEQAIPKFEDRLLVKASREKRRSQALGPHSKAQGARKEK